MRRRSGLSPVPIEFLPRRFYLVVVRERTTCSIHRTKDTNCDVSNSQPTSGRHLFPRTPGIHFVSLQEQLLPSIPSSSEIVLGIPQTIRFNSFLTSILSEATASQLVDDSALRHPIRGNDSENVHYFFLQRRHLREELQVIHLICRWRLLYLQLPPHEALAPFEHLPYLFSSFLSTSDSFLPPNLLLSLAGIAKGLEMELLGPRNATAWDSIRQQGDDEPNLWTVSRRFIVFSRTFAETEQKNSEAKHDDESALLDGTISALKRRRVSLVVMLSKVPNDVNAFAARGLEVVDISSTISLGDTFPRSDEVVMNRFLEACEGTDGLIAVNASSGSGCVSAATCIGCYLMKHSSFTSQEAIGWLRFCFPVKILLAWEVFLSQMQSQMWLEGERFRRGRQGDLQDEMTDSHTSNSTHINIGNISLGRLSLLGSRDRDKHRPDSLAANIHVNTCLSSRTQELQQSPTAATTTAQLKRRPFTQGSAGTRRYHRSPDGTSLRADFALMHKFLHQTPTPSTRFSAPSSTTMSTTSSLHTIPSRPKASARLSDGTSANCSEALA